MYCVTCEYYQEYNQFSGVWVDRVLKYRKLETALKFQIEYDDIKPLLTALEELNSWTDGQLEKALYNEEEILKDILNVRKEFKNL